MSDCKTETTDQVPCPYCGRRPYLEHPIAGSIAAAIGLALGVSVAVLPATLLFIHESYPVFKGSDHGWEALCNTGIMIGLVLGIASLLSFVVAGFCFFGPPETETPKKAP